MGFAFVVILAVLVIFGWEASQRGLGAAATSSFWVLTWFFLLSYPVKLILIEIGIPYVAPSEVTSTETMRALAVAMAFWMIVLLGRELTGRGLWTRHRKELVAGGTYEVTGRGAVRLADLYAVLLIGVSAWSLFKLMERTGFRLQPAFYGNAQNEARVGSGHVFFLYSLYLKAFLVYLFAVREKRLPVVAVTMAVGGLAVLEMVLLSTRRPLYLVVYAFLLWCVIEGSRKRVAVAMLALMPIVAAAAAPVGQLLRYHLDELVEREMPIDLDWNYSLTIVGSTFEGIEHLSVFLRRITAEQWFLGVDSGSAWVFNLGLALVPRVLWEGKPYLYGSVAEQWFLYPSHYEGGVAQTTLPPGLVVDALFGAGVAGFAGMALILGRLMAWVDQTLFEQGRYANPLAKVVAAGLYIHLFNVVRGGTAAGMMVLVLIIMAAPVLRTTRRQYKVVGAGRSYGNSMRKQ